MNYYQASYQTSKNGEKIRKMVASWRVPQNPYEKLSPTAKLNHMVEMDKSNRLINYLESQKDTRLYWDRFQYTLMALYNELKDTKMDLWQNSAFLLLEIAVHTFYPQEFQKKNTSNEIG